MKTFMSAILAIAISIFSVSAIAAPRVLIVLTSHSQMGNTEEKTGFWLSEMTHPFHELKKAGIKVELASIKGGAAPIDPKSLADNDSINHEFLANPETRKLLDNTLELASVKPEAYQGILFAGGHGTVWDFPTSDAVNKIGSAIFEQGGIVGAVCHGPAALLNIFDKNGKPIIQGKKVAGFSNAEEEAAGLTKIVPYLLQDELIALGGLYQEGKMFESFVVQDERIITGQNPQSASDLGKLLAKTLLNTK